MEQNFRWIQWIRRNWQITDPDTKYELGMNWAQFKDPMSHMCLGGAVVACWSLTQEVVGWQVRVILMS